VLRWYLEKKNDVVVVGEVPLGKLSYPQWSTVVVSLSLSSSSSNTDPYDWCWDTQSDIDDWTRNMTIVSVVVVVVVVASTRNYYEYDCDDWNRASSCADTVTAVEQMAAHTWDCKNTTPLPTGHAVIVMVVVDSDRNPSMRSLVVAWTVPSKQKHRGREMVQKRVYFRRWLLLEPSSSSSSS
jgi:hypothetical protein